MVTVTFALVEPSSVTDDGETEQVAALGAPAQVHVTVRLKPPIGAMEALKLVVSPAVTVRFEGPADTAKSEDMLVEWTDWRAWKISSRPLPIVGPIGCA
jgi:hypothetical protein